MVGTLGQFEISATFRGKAVETCYCHGEDGGPLTLVNWLCSPQTDKDGNILGNGKKSVKRYNVTYIPQDTDNLFGSGLPLK